MTNSKGQTPLWLAVAHGRVDVARTLIKHGADVNIPDSSLVTPLIKACSMNTSSGCILAELLLDSGAHVNLASKDGMTALHWSVRNKLPDLIDRLLKQNADVQVSCGWLCILLNGTY